jgi:retron-type reverse transcriptase
VLGVPTVADRVAQTVVAMVLEAEVERRFLFGLLWLSSGPFGS